MKLDLSILLILTFSLSTSSLSATISVLEKGDPIKANNSLVLQKNNSSKSVELISGQHFKVWHNSKEVTKGEFIKSQDGEIHLNSDGVDTIIKTENIDQVKVIGSKSKLGQFFLITGIIGMVFGGISLIAGLASLAAESIGAILLVAVPVLGGGGFGLFKLGTKLSGKTYNFRKKWKITDQ